MSDTIEPAIIVHDIHKEFALPQHKHSSLKQLVVNFGSGNKKVRQKVLDGVSFTVNKGDFFGVVGRNGSGKSTLLKILAGVYTPTSGGIEIQGKLAPFIELGVGFNPELTGRDNVFLNGALLGFNHKEMEDMYDDIVDFAELAPFMDQKLKNYSSGMQVRLAFSIAIKARSEILLIDEVLAVGDANFQKKCMEVFEDLKRQGRTIVFVTHAMESVREFCNRVVVLDKGKVIVDGDPEKAIDAYNRLNFETEGARVAAENDGKEGMIERFGNGHARFTSYKLFDKDGKETIQLAAGQPFSAELIIDFKEAVANPAVGVMIRKNPLENLLGINNFYNDQHFGAQKAGDKLKVKLSGTMPLAPGTYLVSFSVSDVKSASNYTELDNLNNVLKITVDGKRRWGLLVTDIKMEAEKA